jgi:hypothetical protein
VLKLILAVALTALLSGCTYDGSYRYPCQDPANWETAECKPPICDVNNTCPKDLNTNITEETKGTTNG